MEATIKVKSFEPKLVDQLSQKIFEIATKEGAKVSGPIPLPTRRELFTILRSVHVNKKSREQFELRTHKRLLKITGISETLKETLTRIKVPASITMEIKISK